MVDSTIKNRKEAKAWQIAHEKTSPEIGSVAPDFELSDSNGANPIRLSSFRNRRPVALVFGSFT